MTRTRLPSGSTNGGLAGRGGVGLTGAVVGSAMAPRSGATCGMVIQDLGARLRTHGKHSLSQTPRLPRRSTRCSASGQKLVDPGQALSLQVGLLLYPAMLRTIFAFFLGLMLTAFVGVGVYTFHPPPVRFDNELRDVGRREQALRDARAPNE